MISPATTSHTPVEQTSTRYRRQVGTALASAKQRLISRYERIAPGKSRRIRHALAKAETLAWAMPFPHLVLPDLAELEVAKLLAPNEQSLARSH